ncbi:MAG: DUF488 domain-containing protein [Burkholderiales bacterium]
MKTIRIKRVYEPPAAGDGERILIDRLWPRGLSKANAKIDLWLKEIAPSDALRKWFDHEASKWPAFRERYAQELECNTEPVAQLKARIRSKSATLLYGAREERHNNAVALKMWLEGR